MKDLYKMKSLSQCWNECLSGTGKQTRREERNVQGQWEKSQHRNEPQTAENILSCWWTSLLCCCFFSLSSLLWLLYHKLPFSGYLSWNDLVALCGIESFRLEESSKIIKSNHNLAMSPITKPWPWCHVHTSYAPLGMGIPPLQCVTISDQRMGNSPYCFQRWNDISVFIGGQEGKKDNRKPSAHSEKMDVRGKNY